MILAIFKWGNKRNKKLHFSYFFLILSIIFVSFVQFGLTNLLHTKKIELNYFGIKSDPDGQDYNRNRAMAVAGSGGFYGKGYKNASVSSVRTNHVPESETDFIFCPLLRNGVFRPLWFVCSLCSFKNLVYCRKATIFI